MVGDACGTYQVRCTITCASCPDLECDGPLVNVVDNEDPEFDQACPANATVECDNVPAAAVLTATDNCAGVVSVDFDEQSTKTNDGSCTDFNYTITRTWTAEDDCGNDVECVQILTVQDTEKPEWSLDACTNIGMVTVTADARLSSYHARLAQHCTTRTLR